ncbi:26760_t:CDS:2 [Gigaspora margarita]|uniref:26760_t:CDS:1 n=1 Tax=Gigaspora margarita TaxID=4874 RepID=A0ABN7UID3_GIGMA|nr:26760_t:CDS:2 [Gigaspora margarita]
MELDVEFENNQDLKSSLTINDFNLSSNPIVDFNNRQIQGFFNLNQDQSSIPIDNFNFGQIQGFKSNLAKEFETDFNMLSHSSLYDIFSDDELQKNPLQLHVGLEFNT